MIQVFLTLNILIKKHTQCFTLETSTVKTKDRETEITIMFHLSCLILKNLKLGMYSPPHKAVKN